VRDARIASISSVIDTIGLSFMRNSLKSVNGCRLYCFAQMELAW